MVMKGALRTARSEAGSRYQLTCYSTEDLRRMRDAALDTAEQLTAFIDQLHDELMKRDVHPSNPDVAS